MSDCSLCKKKGSALPGLRLCQICADAEAQNYRDPTPLELAEGIGLSMMQKCKLLFMRESKSGLWKPIKRAEQTTIRRLLRDIVYEAWILDRGLTLDSLFLETVYQYKTDARELCPASVDLLVAQCPVFRDVSQRFASVWGWDPVPKHKNVPDPAFEAGKFRPPTLLEIMRPVGEQLFHLASQIFLDEHGKRQLTFYAIAIKEVLKNIVSMAWLLDRGIGLESSYLSYVYAWDMAQNKLKSYSSKQILSHEVFGEICRFFSDHWGYVREPYIPQRYQPKRTGEEKIARAKYLKHKRRHLRNMQRKLDALEAENRIIRFKQQAMHFRRIDLDGEEFNSLLPVPAR